MNQVLLAKTKYQLILGAFASTVAKSTTKECLCYHGLNAVRIYQNEKAVRLFVCNSAIFFYQANQ